MEIHKSFSKILTRVDHIQIVDLDVGSCHTERAALVVVPRGLGVLIERYSRLITRVRARVG